MPRKAFLLGRNTGSLRHSCVYNEAGELEHCDIKLMQECLRQHGYEITLPPNDALAGQIQDHLHDFLDACAQEDSIIFYFSGHSRVVKGRLGLVLAEPMDKGSHALYAEEIMARMETCSAGSKLLILDCCEAGLSAKEWKPKGYFRVLTAADNLHRSKEIDGLNAGVFTYHLHRALTDSTLWTKDGRGVTDTNGKIWLAKLHEWLGEAVPEYGKSQSRKDIPVPQLYGQADDILLAEVVLAPKPNYRDHYTERLSQALKAAFQRQKRQQIHGQDTRSTQIKIAELKRRLREGGRLRAGDYLKDNRFQLIKPLKDGGFGQVWKSYDEHRKAVVAIKVLHGQFADDRTRRERFFRGARYMQALDHPNIVRVFEGALEDSGYYFFVMEYLECGDFRQAVLDNRIPAEQRLSLILAVGAALQFAHEHELVHRDVKPENIILDGQQKPKLTDDQ